MKHNRMFICMVVVLFVLGVAFAQDKQEQAKPAQQPATQQAQPAPAQKQDPTQMKAPSSPTKSGKSMAKKTAKETTIDGEVVEVSCYLAHGEKGMGEEHKACGEACAKNGSPLGILTKDGKLYVSVLPDDHSTGPNAKLIDHIAHQVRATGIVRSKGGVNGMMITKVEMAGGDQQQQEKKE